MADHAEVQYSTADGNDYPEHEGTYSSFIHFSFIGALHVISVVLGIGIVGITSHWLIGAIVIFVIATIGLVHGLATGTRGVMVGCFVLALLAFAYSTMS
jgi:hypothetical protein